MAIKEPYSAKALLKTFLKDVSQKNKLNAVLENYLTDISPIDKLKKIDEIPFSSDRKYSACIYEGLTLVLGAPEILLEKNTKVFKNVEAYTKESYRVVTFGQIKEKFDKKNGEIKKKFQPLAVIALDDPIREETPPTLAALVKENMQYRIISGDSPDTVMAIAKKIDKNHQFKPISGEELAPLQGSELEKAIMDHNIYARIKPQQKQLIIKTLKENKLFTIMIGDGVNDVLALKESDLSIAMNGGSSMAKDVADVVLVNNSFSTLPLLLFEGRRIITNIQTIANIYLIKNVSSIASILMLGFIGLRFPFDPKHVELSSLLIVGLPSFVLAFEKHNFHTTNEGFIKRLLLFSGIVGFGNAVIYTIVYTYFDLTSSTLFYSRSILLTSVIFLGINNIILIYLQHYTFNQILKRKIVIGLITAIFLIFVISILSSISRNFFEVKKITLIDFMLSLSFSIAGSIAIAYILRKLHLLYKLPDFKNIASNPPIVVVSTPSPSQINP